MAEAYPHLLLSRSNCSPLTLLVDEGGPIIGCSVGERLFLRLEALLTSHLETVKEQLIEEIGEVQGDSDSSFDVALLGRYVEERERYHLATKINTDLLTLVSRGRLPRIPAQKNEKASRSIFEIPLLHSMLWKDVVLFGSDGIWEDLKFAAEKLVGVREGGKVVDESFAKKVVHAVGKISSTLREVVGDCPLTHLQSKTSPTTTLLYPRVCTACCCVPMTRTSGVPRTSTRCFPRALRVYR
jgi:hypothetical protein